MRRVDGIYGLLHFRIDTFLESVGTLLQPWLDHASVLLDGQRRVLIQIVDDPALALGHRGRAKLFARKLIAPIAKPTLRKFLDVAFVHQRDAFAPMPQRILDSSAYQPLRPSRRNGFYAYTRIDRK